MNTTTFKRSAGEPCKTIAWSPRNMKMFHLHQLCVDIMFIKTYGSHRSEKNLLNVNGVLEEDQLELTSGYFQQGYSFLEILEFLKLHRVTISISTLKNLTWKLKLVNTSCEYTSWRGSWKQKKEMTNNNPEVVTKLTLMVQNKSVVSQEMWDEMKELKAAWLLQWIHFWGQATVMRMQVFGVFSLAGPQHFSGLKCIGRYIKWQNRVTNTEHHQANLETAVVLMSDCMFFFITFTKQMTTKWMYMRRPGWKPVSFE